MQGAFVTAKIQPDRQFLQPEVRLSTNFPNGKMTSGLIRLGRWAVCGLKWRTQDAPAGMKGLVELMQKIPVATHKAFHTLAGNSEIWSDLCRLFKRADAMELTQFLEQASRTFSRANIVISLSLPNNHLCLEQGARVGGKLLQIEKESISFKKGLALFQQQASLKSVFYEMFGMDLFKVTEAQRRFIFDRLESHGFSFTGRLVIEDMGDRSIDWMETRAGRKYYHISRAMLDKG